MTALLVKEGKAYAIWIELREPKMDLLPGDIDQAIQWFNEEIGTMPKLVLLNPKCQHLAGEAPEDITVEISGMPLAHEIMMATCSALITPEKTPPLKIGPEKPLLISDDLQTIMSTINDRKNRSGHNSPAGPQQNTIGKRGPKFRDDIPLDLIDELSRQDNGPRAIASILKGQGIIVSYKTIQRILAGQRQLI